MVVAHGGWIMEFINVIKSFIAARNGTQFEDEKNNNAKNTCVNIFALKQNLSSPILSDKPNITFEITLFNDASHLEKTIFKLT